MLGMAILWLSHLKEETRPQTTLVQLVLGSQAIYRFFKI